MKADLLLFRRMRGLFWVLLVVLLGVLPAAITAFIGIGVNQSWFDSETRAEFVSPTEIAGVGIVLISLIGTLTAVLFGSTAGSVDLQRGVLRDLVLTGRSRTSIALRRILAASIWTFIGIALSVALVMAAAYGSASDVIDTGAADWDQFARDIASMGPSLLGSLAIGAGVALLVGSRGPAIGIYFAFALVVDNILVVIPKIGDWWEKISLSAAESQTSSWITGDGPMGPVVQGRSDEVAALVFAGWIIVPLALGLLRLSKRDL